MDTPIIWLPLFFIPFGLFIGMIVYLFDISI